MMNVWLLLALLIASSGPCSGQLTCPAEFPLLESVLLVPVDNICVAGGDCQFRDMTVSIDVFNVQTVNFVFIALDLTETQYSMVVTEVDTWNTITQAHSNPADTVNVALVWTDPTFAYTNLTVETCQIDGCQLDKCTVVDRCSQQVDQLNAGWVFTPSGGSAALGATPGWLIAQGEELCITWEPTAGTPEPFLLYSGSMTVTGQQNGLTYEVDYYAPNTVSAQLIKTNKKGTFAKDVAVPAAIHSSGFRVIKNCIFGDKGVVITDLLFLACV